MQLPLHLDEFAIRRRHFPAASPRKAELTVRKDARSLGGQTNVGWEPERQLVVWARLECVTHPCPR